jgi:hypothetical protein
MDRLTPFGNYELLPFSAERSELVKLIYTTWFAYIHAKVVHSARQGICTRQTQLIVLWVDFRSK